MNEQPSQRLFQTAWIISRIASACVFGVGLLGLMCWVFRSQQKAGLFPGLMEMKANTAFGFVLSGISLWLVGRQRGPLIARRAGQAVALGVIAIGVLALGEFFFNWFPGFDEWLSKGPEESLLPGRMSYLSAMNFFLLGLGLLLVDLKLKRGPDPGQFFTLMAVMICLLAVIGYIVGLGIFYGETSLFPGTRMSRTATGLFLILGTGILCARPDGGLMRILMSGTDGGFILRRLLLLPVVVPLAAGAIPKILRYVHLTDPAVGSWIFSFGDILLFTLIFWWSAALLYRTDVKRHLAEEQLKTLNNDLEHRVLERTTQLLATNRELRSEVAERRNAEDEVRKFNASLEQRVNDRTAQINTAYRELESFSYSVSHDLRAPLRAIGNYSAMLQEENPNLSEDSRTYLQSAQRNVEKMQLLIDDLLSFSRVNHQALQKQKVALDEIARQCFAELQPETKGRPIKFSVSGDLPVHADPVLLKQLMLNLLSNAIKFTRRQELAAIEVGSLPPKDGTNGPVYYVRDNGAGFEMSSVGKLFGVFQRLHKESDFEGTGLGLAIVQNIVNRHGGRVWAESAPDKGATFFFTLPD